MQQQQQRQQFPTLFHTLSTGMFSTPSSASTALTASIWAAALG
jgi:hypothetical protein